MMKRHIILSALAWLLWSAVSFAVVPQPIALPGLYTLAAGADNLQTNLPAAGYPLDIAWAIDRPGGAGYMVSDGSTWTSNAGPAGTNGNTILSGTGAPAAGLGSDGDFYVDVVLSRMYGPKTSGIWGTGVSLIGPVGATGASGAAATVAVGTVSTLAAGASATVANSGSTSAAMLNFGIPQGIVGATGSAGATGATGGVGATGPAGVNAFGSPNSRALSAATAYQCTDTTKPCVVSVTVTSTANFSLTGGTTNTAALLIGSTTGVATGTGTVIGNYTNSITGAIAVGLNMNSQSVQTYTLAVPIGWYFAVRVSAGTVSINSAFDQSVG